MKLSISITTFNEEANIERTLNNIKDIADEIIIIDGQSNDNTVKIARKYTNKVFVVPNALNLNVNKQKGIDKCSGDWILYLDADEALTEGLKREIKKVVNSNTRFNGFYIPRKAIVFGRWIKHGGHYPDYQLRLFRNGKGRFEMVSVHEPLKIDGSVGYLKHPIDHFGYYKSFDHYFKKMNHYSTNDAKQMVKQKTQKSKLDIFYKPAFMFFFHYIYKLGFLDGWYGFAFAVSSSFYEFMIYIKYFELKKHLNKLN